MLDIAIISFNDAHPLKSRMQLLFPDANVFVQSAVDIRNVPMDSLLSSKIINETAYTTLTSGRKWHWEFNSRGGVGLSEANRLCLSRSTNPLLLFEEDCEIHCTKKLKETVEFMLQHETDFDLVTFDPLRVEGQRKKIDLEGKKCEMITNGNFWGLHCVLYSSAGRKFISNYLTNNTLSMQIDGLYSFLANSSQLRVFVIADKIVFQTRHLSTIQTDFCHLCDLEPSHKLTFFEIVWNYKIIICFTLLIIIIMKTKMHCNQL